MSWTELKLLLKKLTSRRTFSARLLVIENKQSRASIEIRGRQMIKIIGSKDHWIFNFWSDFFFLDQDFEFYFWSIFFALDHITTSGDLYFFPWIILNKWWSDLHRSGSYHKKWSFWSKSSDLFCLDHFYKMLEKGTRLIRTLSGARESWATRGQRTTLTFERLSLIRLTSSSPHSQTSNKYSFGSAQPSWSSKGPLENFKN